MSDFKVLDCPLCGGDHYRNECPDRPVTRHAGFEVVDAGHFYTLNSIDGIRYQNLVFVEAIGIFQNSRQPA